MTTSSPVLLTQPQGLDVGNLHQLALLVAVRVSSGSVQLERSFSAGVVTSPNYPGEYSDHLVMTDKIGVDQGLVIVVQFTDFETEKSRDWLTITDGDGTALMEKTSGAFLPANVSSRSNAIKFYFKTDQSVRKRGWSFSWSAVTPGGSTTSFQIAAGCGWFLCDLIANTEDSAMLNHNFQNHLPSQCLFELEYFIEKIVSARKQIWHILNSPNRFGLFRNILPFPPQAHSRPTLHCPWSPGVPLS